MRLAAPDDGPERLVLEITPMIDVVFLLLVFFMLATTFLDPEREIDLDLPPASSASERSERTEEIVINVLRDGSLKLGAREVDDSELASELRRAARRDPDASVTIRGDRRAVHEAVVSVMDACGRAGLRNLAVGTIEGS